MKKTRLKTTMWLIHIVNSFFNETKRPEDDSEDLLRYLLLNKDISYQIKTFESLKKKFENELMKREMIAQKEAHTISSYLAENIKVIYSLEN